MSLLPKAKDYHEPILVDVTATDGGGQTYTLQSVLAFVVDAAPVESLTPTLRDVTIDLSEEEGSRTVKLEDIVAFDPATDGVTDVDFHFADAESMRDPIVAGGVTVEPQSTQSGRLNGIRY